MSEIRIDLTNVFIPNERSLCLKINNFSQKVVVGTNFESNLKVSNE